MIRPGNIPAPVKSVRFSSWDKLNARLLSRFDGRVARLRATPQGQRRLIITLNAVTVTRGLLATTVLAPALYTVLGARLTGWPALAAATTLLAVIVLLYYSDSLDGSAARRWHLITRFGKLVDPAADKLLTWSVVLPLLLTAWSVAAGWAHHNLKLLLCFMALEVAIVVVTFLEDWFGRKPEAGPAGKWKMMMQFVFVFLMYVGVWLAAAGSTAWSGPFLAASSVFIILAGSLAVISLGLHARNLARRA